jgi:hypothetical protein
LIHVSASIRLTPVFFLDLAAATQAWLGNDGQPFTEPSDSIPKVESPAPHEVTMFERH